MWQGTTGYHSSCELWTGATPIDSKILLLILSFGSYHKIFIEVCPEKVQPSLIQWELFVWHQCNLATKKRVLECACVNNDNFTVLVSGAVDAVDCVLCGCYIQNDWTSWAINLHQILHWAWTFLHGNYLDDSEGFPGWCNEHSTNKSVAQMLQRWWKICWKWSMFWKACNKQDTWECWTCTGCTNKDRWLTVWELEADLGIPELLCRRFSFSILAWNMLRQNSFSAFCYQSRRNIALL